MTEFEFTEQDRKFTDLYKDFLPEKVIDAHMHLWTAETIPSFYGTGVFFREQGTAEDYRKDMSPMLPGVKEIGLMMMTMLDPAMADRKNGLRDAADRYIAGQAAEDAFRYRMSPYILPADTEEEIAARLDETGGAGIKVYGFGTGKTDISNVGIAEFLPEAAWVVAEERKVPVILHILKAESLSDPENYAYISRMTEKYPEAPLVLAHCARSFVSWTGIGKIRDLADHGNIWFDLSAICEPGPMMACILKNAGKRVMWGSDYPNSMYRGRAVTTGFGQNWLLDLEDPNRVLIGEENLLAFYQTALLLDLDSTRIEDIFYNNAKRLYFGGRQG